MTEWKTIESAPEGVPIRTKISDWRGERNDQVLTKRTRIPGKTRPMWFTHDGQYVYYDPTHWTPTPMEKT